MIGTADEALLRALHDEHARSLWAYTVRLTGGDQGRAQDVVQETLLRAWRTPAVLTGSHGSVAGWLRTVARRIVIDEWRTRRHTAEVLSDAVPEAPGEDEAQRAVDRAVVLDALRALSPEHRAVLIECYFHDATIAEAATRLGLPTGTVKSRTHYALRALRLAMDERRSDTDD